MMDVCVLSRLALLRAGQSHGSMSRRHFRYGISRHPSTAEPYAGNFGRISLMWASHANRGHPVPRRGTLRTDLEFPEEPADPRRASLRKACFRDAMDRFRERPATRLAPEDVLFELLPSLWPALGPKAGSCQAL